MSREILFRGKRVDNGEWVYGQYNKIVGQTEMLIRFDVSDKKDHEFKTFDLDMHLITETILPDRQGWDYGGCFIYHRVIPETVGQLTGLCDKNGAKIFEGDTLNGSMYQDVVVEWDSTHCGWNITGHARTTQVTGNIHDKQS